MRQKSGIERFESPLPLGFCSRAGGPLAWSVGPLVSRYPRLAARGSRRLRRLVITRELSSLERLHSLVVQESEALLSLREICDFPLAAKTRSVFATSRKYSIFEQFHSVVPVLTSPGFYERLASLTFRASIRSLALAHENAERSAPSSPTRGGLCRLHRLAEHYCRRTSPSPTRSISSPSFVRL